MILLDTHIWIWWVNNPAKLDLQTLYCLDNLPAEEVYVSVILCWAIAKLVQNGRLNLPETLDDWFDNAINRTGITLTELEKPIIIDTCNLPGSFHKDPADQLIVATSRVRNLPLLTADGLILAYEHVTHYTS